MMTARDEAEAATQVKSKFLSNMSHELRSPLNAILAFSEKLVNNKDNNLSEREIKSASIINRSGGELLRLIDDILDLAKVEAGMIELEVDEFSLPDLLQTLMDQQTPLVEAKKSPLDFKLIVADQVPEIIQTDPLRLGQIVRNLLSNAIKFTSKGAIIISVELLTQSRLAISVSDTGIGINPENLAHIFEAFRQEDSSVTRRFGGTGLGLSISLNLIDLLGGDIRIHSQINEGSCFTVELPFDLPKGKKSLPLADNAQKRVQFHNTVVECLPEKELTHKPPEETRVHGESSIPAGANVLANKTILLVEDNVTNVEIVESALEDYELNIIVAENGQVALDTLTQGKIPHIILMDLMMPVMDGYEAIKLIRENSLWESLPIIVLTASKMEATKDLCFELGATDYMNKPLDMSMLVSKMAHLIADLTSVEKL